MPARTLAVLKQSTSKVVFSLLTLSVLPATLVGLYRGFTESLQPFFGAVIASCAVLASAVVAFLMASPAIRPLIVCISCLGAALGAVLLYGELGEGASYALIATVLATLYYGRQTGVVALVGSFAAMSWLFHIMRSPVALYFGLETDFNNPEVWVIPILELAICGPPLIWGTTRFCDRLTKALLPTSRPALYWELPTGEINAFDIWDELDQPVLVVNPEMQISACNPAAVDFFERAESELIGKYTYDFVYPGTSYPFPLKWNPETADQIDSQQEIVTFRTESGRAVLADVKVRSIQDASGRVKHLIVLLHDRTADSDLQHQRNFNNLLWKQGGVAIATFDTETRFVSANPGMEQMLGYASDELQGRAAREMVFDQTLIVGSGLPFPERVKTADPTIPAVLRHKGGAKVSAFVRVYPIRDPMDPKIAFIGLAINVSEQANLRRRSNVLSAIWNRLGERVAIVGPDDCISSSNLAFAELLGHSTDSLTNLSIRAIDGPLDVDWLMRCIERARRGENVTDSAPAPAVVDAQPRWYLGSFAPFSAEGALDGSVIVILTDVTSSHNAESARKSTEAQYEQLLSSVLDAVISTDTNGKIVAANPAAVKLFEYPRAELLEKPLDMLLPKRSRAGHNRLMQGYANSGAAGRGMANFREVQGITKSGREVYLEIAIAQVGVGREKKLTAVIRDLTERRHLEGRVRHLDKMRAIGQLAAGIAHDFNNIMAVISGSSELGIEDLPAKDPSRRLFERILGSAHLGKDLTASLLAFARGEVQELQPLDVEGLMETMKSMLARTFDANIAVRCEVEPDCWPLMADRSQLQNVLLNMAINARDAMPNGGTLTLKARNVIGYTLVDQAGNTRPADMVEIDVADTGTGMSEEVRQRALEPFFTTKPAGKGTGLGLATAFGVIQRSGGALEISSEVGRGTTIKVFLPRALTIEQSADAPVLDGPRQPTKTVLLVEDNDPLRVTLTEQLGRSEFVVHAAATAAAARELFAAHDDIDILLSDYRLAEDTTGIDLATEFRSLRPELSVIIMTGYLEVSATRKAPPGTIMMTKPVPFRDLLKELHRTMAPAA